MFLTSSSQNNELFVRTGFLRYIFSSFVDFENVLSVEQLAARVAEYIFNDVKIQANTCKKTKKYKISRAPTVLFLIRFECDLHF